MFFSSYLHEFFPIQWLLEFFLVPLLIKILCESVCIYLNFSSFLKCFGYRILLILTYQFCFFYVIPQTYLATHSIHDITNNPTRSWEDDLSIPFVVRGVKEPQIALLDFKQLIFVVLRLHYLMLLPKVRSRGSIR